MQQGSNKNTAIIGIIAIVIIAAAVIGTIALKPQSNTASGNNGSSTSSTTSDSTTTSTNIDPNATYKTVPTLLAAHTAPPKVPKILK
jgi:FlaG/FlaF family flagellin (archaellin)